MSRDLNHVQKRWTFDNEQYRAAGERREQHGRKVAEAEAEVVRQLNLRPHTPQESKELSQVGRQLRQQERIIKKMERLRDTNYDLYMERFSDHYARLTSTN